MNVVTVYTGDHKSVMKFPYEIDYLGYNFSIGCTESSKQRPRQFRSVTTGISEKKIKKIKTRISKSFLQFKRDKKFADLLDRLKLLSGNYKFIDYHNNVTRTAGLFCNYRYMDQEGAENLEKLNAYFRGIVFGKSANIFADIPKYLTIEQRRRLLKIDFYKSFNNKPFFGYSPERLEKLTRCWKHEK